MRENDCGVSRIESWLAGSAHLRLSSRPRSGRLKIAQRFSTGNTFPKTEQPGLGRQRDPIAKAKAAAGCRGIQQSSRPLFADLTEDYL